MRAEWRDVSRRWWCWREKRGREERVKQGDRKDSPLVSSFISFLHGEMCVLDASISLSWWNRCAVNFKRHANLSHHNVSGRNTWYIYTGTIYCCLRGDGWRGWGRWAAASWCACERLFTFVFRSSPNPKTINVALRVADTSPSQMSEALGECMTRVLQNASATGEPGCASIPLTDPRQFPKLLKIPNAAD